VSAAAVLVEGLRRTYGDRVALDGVSFEVAAGEIFGLLGPNGGGKTTLFRVLTTVLPPSAGGATVLGHRLPGAEAAVRAGIGIVFQEPSLDAKLTVRENLMHQGHLYGLRGRDLDTRIDRGLEWFGLTDRAGERAESLSGGLKRRAELAKGLLHDPALLLLDEPSTGLDPGARHDLWTQLRRLREERGVTCLLTTHLMREAEQCDRVGILDRGRLVALGTPAELRASVGGEVVSVEPTASGELEAVRADVARVAGTEAVTVGGTVRVEAEGGAALVPLLVAELGERAASITVGRPTLLDVFLHETGREWE